MRQHFCLVTLSVRVEDFKYFSDRKYIQKHLWQPTKGQKKKSPPTKLSRVAKLSR